MDPIKNGYGKTFTIIRFYYLSKACNFFTYLNLSIKLF